jgi:hypothetical protein
MSTWEMASMYVPNNEFHAAKIDGILPHFVVLYRMMRRTLTPRIGDSNTIPTFESKLLDVVMKNEHFDVFDYIIDEIWNIAMCMIETVAHERFYKDVAHEALHPVAPEALVHHDTSPPLDVAPSHATRGYGASSSSSSANFRIMKMFWGIFVMCHHIE